MAIKSERQTSERGDALDDAHVAPISARRADRDRRDRLRLDEGIDAAIETLQATVGWDLDVQVMVVATFGDPIASEPDDPTRWRAVPIHASFASLRAGHPLTETHRRYLAMEGLRAVSPALRDGLAVAVGVLDALEDLERRAEDGDPEAQRKRALLLEALERDAPPSPTHPEEHPK